MAPEFVMLFCQTDVASPGRFSALLTENWTALLPVVLGAVAVYLLLPRPRGRAAVVGAVLGVAALVIAGATLVHVVRPVHPEVVLFYGFAGLALVAGGAMIAQRSPARSAIAFAIVVLSTCGLFLLQAAPFLMAATIIIYAGAIIVTFLFVLMLAQQTGPSDADDRSREPLLSVLAGFALLGCLVLVLLRGYDYSALDKLIRTAKHAAGQSDAQAMMNALGDPATYLAGLDREARRLAGTDAEADFGDAVKELSVALNARQPRTEEVRPALLLVVNAGRRARGEYGALRPPAGLPLSGYAGAPPHASIVDERAAQPAPPHAAESLPAENVAALGRTLFSDHLLAIELGGTLLLVATIGTIAIAGRRRRAGA